MKIEAIKKYLHHNSEKRFNKLIQILQEADNKIEIIDYVCKNMRHKNNMHLGLLHLIGQRFLISCYYYKLHLTSNPNDTNSWINYQYASLKRGDIKTSLFIIEQLLPRSNQQTINLILMMHHLALGHPSIAVNNALKIIEGGIVDNFTLNIIYETALTSQDYTLVESMLKIPRGRALLKNCSPLDNYILKEILVQRITIILRNYMKNGV